MKYKNIRKKFYPYMLTAAIAATVIVPSQLTFAATVQSEDQITVAPAANDVIQTKTELAGQRITVTVSAQAGQPFTSGQISLFYDDSILTPESIVPNGSFDLEDLNVVSSGNGEVNIQFAFASLEEVSDVNLFTVTFEAAEGTQGTATNLTTKIDELYLDETPLAQSGTTFLQSVLIGSDVQTADRLIPIREVQATSASYQSVFLSWKAAERADGYTIYRAETKTGNYKKIASFDSNAFRVTYTDTGLKTGHTYFYKIKAYRTLNGHKEYGSSQSIQAQPLPKTTGFISAAYGHCCCGHMVTLKWNVTEGVSGYELYRSTDANQGYTLLSDITSGTTTTYKDHKEITSGTTFFYKLKPYILVNGQKVYTKTSQPIYTIVPYFTN